MHFRKDLNGLRAIAVIGVVLFHFNPSWLTGGFAGVDIFFVISGFLMTKIIFKGLENNSLSLIKFYAARATRIMPALAVLCLMLLAFGWLYLIPLEYKTLSAHAGSSMIFLSNIVYLKEAGYFDSASHEKWLLHTWSLSVEWQFYIIYPLALVGMKKIMATNTIKISIAYATAIAFVFCIFATYTWPDPSYYLLPTRAWEMLVGGLAYLYPINAHGKKKVTLEWLGLILILCAYFFISGNSPWPGYLALIPVTGTYLIIQAQNNNSRITNNFVFQKLGLWSYSIYLWHWVFVVANIKYTLNLSAATYIFIVILSGFLSYTFFERGKNTLILLVATLLFSAYVFLTNGAQARVSETFRLDKNKFHEKYYGGSGYPANKVFYLNSENRNYDIMFAGDSYGLQYAKAIDNRGIKAAALFDHGCLILPTYSRYINNKEDISCSEEYGKLKNELSDNDKPLLIANSWDTYSNILIQKGSNAAVKITIPEYHQIIQSELDTLIKENGTHRLYFIIGVPQRSKINAYECLSRTELLGYRLIDKCSETQKKSDLQINNVLNEFSKKYSNIIFINPNDFLCDKQNCLVIKNREPIHSDQGHLSVFGAPIVLEGVLKRIQQQTQH